MLDTLEFTLRSGAFKILEPDSFNPSTDTLYDKPMSLYSVRIYCKSISSSNKTYAPQLTLMEYTYGGREIVLRVKLSAAKFLQGNNLFSIREDRREDFCYRLTETLAIMGVETTAEAIEAAELDVLHIAHNMISPFPVPLITADLRRAKMPKSMEIRDVSYPNGGTNIHFHYDKWEMALYEKVADMERLKKHPKQAMCFDKYPERLYEKYLEGWRGNILRFECRFNDNNYIHKFLSEAAHTKELKARYEQGVSVKDVFDNRLIKAALRNKWREIEAGMSKLPSYKNSMTEYINDAVMKNPSSRGDKLLNLVPVAALIAENGVKAARDILGGFIKTERKVDSLIEGAISLKTKKHNMIYTGWITEALRKFSPLIIKSLTKRVNYCKLLLNMKNKQFFTIEEIAEHLRVSEMTIYRYIKNKKLTAYKLGRKAYRINNADLQAFLEKVKSK